MFGINSFRKTLNTEIIGNPHIAYYPEVTSTNDVAIEHSKDVEAKEGLLVMSDYQTAGRGRYGRSWQAPKGKCILASIVFRHRLKRDHVYLPNLIGALSIAQGIQDYTGLDARIKHPNDVRITGKKVAGVLTEMEYDKKRQPFFVLGFGVNVNINKSEFSQELRDTSTSVLIAASESAGTEISRETLLQTILLKLEANYEYLKSGEIDMITDTIKEWEEKA